MRFFVFSNVFVALCATGMAISTHLTEGLPVSWSTLALVFFATHAVYNLDRLVDSSDRETVKDSPRHAWIEKSRRPLWIVALCSAVGTVVSLFMVPQIVLIGVAPLAAISAAYSIPFRGKRLKDLPGAKTALIAAVWALVTAGLPLLVSGRGLIDALLTMATLERFIFIFAITIPFEIRDVERDREAGVVTIAHLLGESRARGLAALLLGAFAIATGARFVPSQPEIAGALIISAVLTIPLVLTSTPQRRDFFFSVLMDGTMLVQAGLVATFANV